MAVNCKPLRQASQWILLVECSPFPPGSYILEGLTETTDGSRRAYNCHLELQTMCYVRVEFLEIIYINLMRKDSRNNLQTIV